MGNGGFSLRRIQACLALFREFSATRERILEDLRAGGKAAIHEDFFFGMGGEQSIEFKVPNERIASTFSLEEAPEWYFNANDGRCASRTAAFLPGFFFDSIFPSASV